MIKKSGEIFYLDCIEKNGRTPLTRCYNSNEIDKEALDYQFRLDRCINLLKNETGTCWINSIIQFTSSIEEVESTKLAEIINGNFPNLECIYNIVETYLPNKLNGDEDLYTSGGSHDDIINIIEKIYEEINYYYDNILSMIDNRDVMKRGTEPVYDASRKRKVSHSSFPHGKYDTRGMKNKTKYLIVKNNMKKIYSDLRKINDYEIISAIVFMENETEAHVLCIKKCMDAYYILDDNKIAKLEVDINKLMKSTKFEYNKNGKVYEVAYTLAVLFKKIE
jgi:hypothetical protein